MLGMTGLLDCQHRAHLAGRRPHPELVILTAAYEVIYDAAQVRFPAWPVALTGGLGAYFRRRGVRSTIGQTIVTSAIIFGVSWTLLVGGGLYAQHGQLQRALREGTFVRVEGIVYDRPPGGAEDAEGPSWVVDAGGTAHWYRYDRSPLAVGYRRSAPGTGGLRNGARVRIADIGGRIARLEVEQ